MPSGCSARNASTCAGRNRWCTEQWPFHSRKVACLASASVRPPRSSRGFHTRMSSAVKPMAKPVLRAEVLVGEEQHLAAFCTPFDLGAEGPLEHRPGVGRGAHGAPVLADERLQGGRRVHVGDGHQPVEIGDPTERLPGLFDLVEVGHVSHRAPGVEIGQHHLLVVTGQDVGRFGHEVHAAEDDVLGLGMLLGEHREAVRIAPGVGPAHDLVALVVVAEDEEPVAEGVPCAVAIHRSSSSMDASVYRSGERGLESQHVVGGPPVRRLRLMTGGDSLVAAPRGCRSRSRYVAGYQAGSEGTLVGQAPEGPEIIPTGRSHSWSVPADGSAPVGAAARRRRPRPQSRVTGRCRARTKGRPRRSRRASARACRADRSRVAAAGRST